jgi:predicted transcriptional regulator
MAMTLRLTDEEADRLRRQADTEQRSMQVVAQRAITEYLDRRARAAKLADVLARELPAYQPVLDRLADA